MTKEEILAMEAGEKLDKIVGEIFFDIIPKILAHDEVYYPKI